MALEKSARADNQVTSAMSVMVVAMLMIPVMDVLAKWLATQYDQTPASITFWRFFVQTILMALLVIVRLRSFDLRSEHAACHAPSNCHLGLYSSGSPPVGSWSIQAALIF